ncbi:prepilin-type N-terminal cleavage/methylation domain-containing protein [Vulcaniibacterium tengchongense]|uniref:General secretion pathway protein J n=1 Tax=Vulcaniibacterium tengchongense TaxID=1273429 RepID=A0A3N4VIM8_9GAMM|nr:prepilin-type N-terminal cleavage/methylation domain-containing protein [Vulcaniibacterium tengchongense]RPE79559.1 general secretion pathway protein J [Vulcaniibacterium tengchongense]
MSGGARAPGRAAGGFTLIEVMLATVLLAAGLGLAFATLGAASRSAARGEAIARDSERMRAVEGFLRARLSAARPVAFGLDPGSALPLRFVGEPERLRFVADLPDYLGRGGPYLHDFALVDDGDGVRMTLGLGMVLAGEVVEETAPRPPDTLVEGLRGARFRYRALDETGRLGPWLDRWPASDRLPLLVEATLVDRDGRAWPPLVVALPQAGAQIGEPMAVTP